MSEDSVPVPESVLPHKRACYKAGCHDFGDPVIVRTGAHLLQPSAEAAIVFCRRCGSFAVGGWTETEE